MCLKGKPHLPEEALIRDALYILQGISGRYVRFVDEGNEKQLVFSDDPVRYAILHGELYLWLLL